MIKVKMKDFFVAGLLFGGISGIIINLYTFIVQMILGFFHVHLETPWGDSVALFFNPPVDHLIAAKVFGFIMSLNMPIFIGILLCLLVKLTGKNYIYMKSIALTGMVTFFTFSVIYPSLGYYNLKYSIATHYHAITGITVFGFILGFLVKKFTDLRVDGIASWN